MFGSRRVVLIAGGLVAFLLVSGLLARWLALENVERDDILAVLSAQARGDAAGMLARLHGCEGPCRVNVIADARRLKRPGVVMILADQSQTAYALTTTVGLTRVAWKVAAGLPVVQCLKVSRRGNALSGLTITLLSVSVPIPNTADC